VVGGLGSGKREAGSGKQEVEEEEEERKRLREACFFRLEVAPFVSSILLSSPFFAKPTFVFGLARKLRLEAPPNVALTFCWVWGIGREGGEKEVKKKKKGRNIGIGERGKCSHSFSPLLQKAPPPALLLSLRAQERRTGVP